LIVLAQRQQHYTLSTIAPGHRGRQAAAGQSSWAPTGQRPANGPRCPSSRDGQLAHLA